ncbi:MAG: PQQ-dependent sugar dehydrogenase, partial [Acidimicrobiia bacterium]|nr:PQQ-dependent sugar dehydrogenase [Acidimicrobiia bacterium]
MAFHPDYASNGRLYVYFTDRELDSRVVEYTTSGLDAAQVDRSTAREIFEIDQPPDSIRHRAGMLEFGPDGFLYIAFGDGGLGGAEAQILDDPHGSVLRVDVDAGDPYAIPATNPFADGGGDPRIFAWGLRNPWRITIDPATNLLYIGDVGQADWEEINVIPIDEPGHDFGWPALEADTTFLGGAEGDETPPVSAYRHVDGACSITGGYVYRGARIPELQGHYFYSDWCAGWIRSLRYDGDTVTDEQQWPGDLERVGQVSSFGLDGDGELLIVTSEGGIFRMVPVR